MLPFFENVLSFLFSGTDSPASKSRFSQRIYHISLDFEHIIHPTVSPLWRAQLHITEAFHFCLWGYNQSSTLVPRASTHQEGFWQSNFD